jgi:Fe-S-cluster containining protein
MRSTALVAERLCLACGLCCNGVLFKDVKLQPGDDAVKLQTLGLPLRSGRGAENHTSSAQATLRKLKFTQPCAALCADNRCHIYADRPVRCRQFECALLKAALARKVEVEAALRTIRIARERAEQVRRLLRELGDANEHVALSLRFRKVKKRMESGAPAEEPAKTFAALTLAVHDLNLLLNESFYPGSLLPPT